MAVVTGASSGLGQQAATILAKSGAQVVGVARRADALASWADEMGGNVAVVAGDVADLENQPELVREIAAPFGAPDILVHAAGLNPRLPAEDLSPDIWNATLAVNLSAPFFLSQAFVPAMKAKGWGRILNFASLQSFRAFPNGLPYGASKGGVAQMTRAMAEAWSSAGINANAIGPGFFETELTAAVFADPERAERNAAQTCIGRNGALGDLDGPLLFLCSEASRYVTGQILMLDGGFTAK
ncbi:SDR family NAD(P)-dependent oxidoreductase [Ruegeria sp. R13_0]|uniref:SDR family NAD(P)-dependent oxidoreductase n=1 Tax=Ruegeria sp. R13_0 TaxID=2821099 RepID=UPI0035304FE5